MNDRNEYLKEYHKNKLKRVPLDLTLEKYDELKTHTTERGETVNGFIKRAIDETIQRDTEEKEVASMEPKKPKGIIYSEPENYFSKEALDILNSENESKSDE